MRRLGNERDDQDTDLEKGNRLMRSGQAKAVEDAYSSVKKTVIGNFYIHSKRLRIHSRGTDHTADYEFHTSFSYHPAQWLLRWNFFSSGLDVMLSRSTKGWKNTLRTFHAVVDDSPIFTFCKNGNIDGVRTLLACGQASPLDTNTNGWTPLHVAAYECNLAICQLLIDAGANQNALTYDFPGGNKFGDAPIVAASTCQRGDLVTWNQRVDVLRLLMKATELDFSESDSQAWKLILVLLERSRPSSGFTSDTRGAQWILDMFREEISTYCPKENLFWLMLFCVEDAELCRRMLDMRPDALNVVSEPGGFSVILARMAENFPTMVIPSFKVLAERGADLHMVGKTRSYGADTLSNTAVSDTATSLALRRSVFFHQWRALLRDLGTDIPAFVEAELQAGRPLAERGWTAETLLKLFETEFEPQEMPRCECFFCGREVYRLYALDELWWEVFLANIKRDSSNYNSDDDEFWSLKSSSSSSSDGDAKSRTSFDSAIHSCAGSAT
ncbi:hypothetical protein VTN77DRAFT_1226 [Rasamsonia byssochlamydoides]|uniref:uncharacterized protein n=1 Tax=Rasamsonia byssochlamydoides TaxID=89139 RepID=UPI00374463F8